MAEAKAQYKEIIEKAVNAAIAALQEPTLLYHGCAHCNIKHTYHA